MHRGHTSLLCTCRACGKEGKRAMLEDLYIHVETTLSYSNLHNVELLYAFFLNRTRSCWPPCSRHCISETFRNLDSKHWFTIQVHHLSATSSPTPNLWNLSSKLLRIYLFFWSLMFYSSVNFVKLYLSSILMCLIALFLNLFSSCWNISSKSLFLKKVVLPYIYWSLECLKVSLLCSQYKWYFNKI